MNYVLGFAFDRAGQGARVALIRKDHPEWQAGRWNGVGGKIEEGESSGAAMEREFREETGVTIPAAAWTLVGTMHKDTEWTVQVFAVTDKRVFDVNTVEREEVRLWYVDAFNYPTNRNRAMANIPALLELCRMKSDAHGTPVFNLWY